MGGRLVHELPPDASGRPGCASPLRSTERTFTLGGCDDRDRLRTWLVGLFYRLLGHRPQGVTIKAKAASSIATAGRARAIVTPGQRSYDDFSLTAERVQYLFERVDSAHEWIGVLREKADQDRKQWRQRHDDLAMKLSDTDDRLWRRTRSIEAGKPGMRFTGFICLGYGVLSTSWAEELARWDPPAFGLLIVAWLSTLVWAWTREDIAAK